LLSQPVVVRFRERMQQVGFTLDHPLSLGPSPSGYREPLVAEFWDRSQNVTSLLRSISGW